MTSAYNCLVRGLSSASWSTVSEASSLGADPWWSTSRPQAPGPAALSRLAALPGLALHWDFSSGPQTLLLPSWGETSVVPALSEYLFC